MCSFSSVSQWTQSTGLNGCSVIDIDIKDTMLFIMTPEGDGIFKKGINQNEWEHSISQQYLEALKVTDGAVIADFGGDLYRSFDLGLTWEAFYIPHWQPVYSIASMGDMLFVSAFSMEDSLYYTTDDGNTWSNITPNSSDMNTPRTWANDGFVYLASDFEPTILYESSNLGVSWDSISLLGLPMSDGRLSTVCRFQNKTWIGGTGGVYCYNGSEWLPQNVGFPENITIGELPIINNTLYGVTFAGNYIFDGIEWIEFSQGLSFNLSYGIVGYNDILYCGGSTGPHKNIPGENWEAIFEGLDFLNIHDLERSVDTMYACTSSGLYISYDFGQTFSRQYIEDIAQCHQIIITDSLLYILSRWDGFTISFDQGLTWITQNTGLPNSAWLNQIGINNENIFLSCNKGFYKCNHGDYEWELISDSLGGYGNLIVIEDTILISSNKVYKSVDNGNSFTEVLDSIYFMQYADGNYYAFSEDLTYNDNYLYNSSDGLIWEKMLLEVHGKMLDAKGSTILLGGIVPYYFENYLSISYDFGNTWIDILDNLTNSWGYSGIFYVQVEDQRTFCSPNDLSLWYHDDLLTSIPFIKTQQNGLYAYPNPFTSSTAIEYQLKDISNIQFTVYNTMGEEIYNEMYSSMPPGSHKVVWSPTHLPGGMYYAVLKSKFGISIVKMIKQ